MLSNQICVRLMCVWFVNENDSQTRMIHKKYGLKQES